MTPLLLLGGGGHCRACIDVIEAEARYQIVGIVQPPTEGTEAVLGYPILGSDDDLPALLAKTPNALVTVGQIKSPGTRRRLFNLLKHHGAKLPVIQSPTAYCSRHATLGEGSLLMHACLINANARIGANCIINSQALIEHDAEIGDHCHIATGARVNGGVLIGEGTFIGSGAILKQGISIGAGAIIGAGQVALTGLPAETTLRSSQRGIISS
ncbi:acetyltransferase [Lamprobacter modestohalophilus]|uniref:Acetyltransferase n=1 Tax=Lamprobacter modestohalophilus TaxID=1064514 RepID=A0A9X1B7A5_9GAMM|nr:NeuD/PglB/VioB family sugar acetyltransferase [Lamprobacter modestohalophilus]MBK1621602.1 acetyltransferase [Lamprobacter modestohalophilus]MCF7980317.1 NeuD/PglB/VioB family sugar acetyltransferase [Chromatiaceae bacterium]MCF8003002.1 NeuD/PglB/VioB family sugar acetyltransferase [Chromatiaceae bacterium]